MRLGAYFAPKKATSVARNTAATVAACHDFQPQRRLATTHASRVVMTIVVVTHDPNIARYAQRVVTFKDGNVLSDTATASGPRVNATSDEKNR